MLFLEDLVCPRFLQQKSYISIRWVGAQTETELKEKKLRVEDALNATKDTATKADVEGKPNKVIKNLDGSVWWRFSGDHSTVNC
ncbi:60 kDa chaperonin [Gossypium arboreum]|uniref:60 kDa chaperonin n=1 Tax=Gossypium arboreum TaxID=29729 RepID=A0A0B0PDY8_GOSAR|nr:60 kDa chaperonin [Gossypium arboreum]